MKRILMFMICSAAFQGFALQKQTTDQTTEKKPNIVVILADDLGHGSVGCYGATKVQTPNIDRIAQEGIRFTDANTPCSVCMPTRYGLLMGEYPWRREIGLDWRPGAMKLPADQSNVASLLQSQGYTTGVVGKWHLGFGEDPVDWRNSLTPGPLERGFDYYFGFPINLQTPPIVYIENRHLIHPEDPLDKDGEGGAEKSQVDYDNMTDVITGKAVSFIETNKDKPFFLYYLTHQVHYPIHPAPRFKGTSDAEIYGDYIQDCDWSVGQILNTLDRLGLTENSLVFFTSDNGGIKNTTFQNPPGIGISDEEIGFSKNAPWSGYKFSSNQGGSRVPFVARWPGKIKSGSQTDTLISLVDFYATFRELLGQKDDGQGPDSVSFLGHLLPERTNETTDRDYVVYQSEISLIGIREKEWLLTVGGVPRKMTAYPAQAKPGTKPARSTLYHLTEDPKEKVNVYNQYPEVAERMERILEKEKTKTLSPSSSNHDKP
jgi:arylsulfatase A-like enzyme